MMYIMNRETKSSEVNGDIYNINALTIIDSEFVTDFI